MIRIATNNCKLVCWRTVTESKPNKKHKKYEGYRNTKIILAVDVA